MLCVTHASTIYQTEYDNIDENTELPRADKGNQLKTTKQSRKKPKNQQPIEILVRLAQHK